MKPVIIPTSAARVRLRKAHGGDRSGLWRKWLDSKVPPALGEREQVVKLTLSPVETAGSSSGAGLLHLGGQGRGGALMNQRLDGLQKRALILLLSTVTSILTF